MGDYPLLINGSKTQANERARTELVSVTGYSPTGALNMVVVPPNSPARAHRPTSRARRSPPASAPPATARWFAHSTTPGIDPKTGVEVLNQQPQVGASALESGQAQALSQFVAWPGLLVFQNKAKLLYDGAEGNYPTFHGVVVRRDYASQHPEVLDAFLQAQLDATEFLNEQPAGVRQARRRRAAGCRRRSSTSTTDPAAPASTPRSSRHSSQAFKGDVPYLKSIGDFADLDIDGFVSDTAHPQGVHRPRPELRRRAEPHDQPVAARRPGPGLQRRGHRPEAGRRTVDRRPGRHPTRRQPRRACCGPSARPPRAARRSAPPTFPTPSSAPGGSPTSRSGCRTAQLPALRHARRCRSATPRHIPARPVVDYQQALAGAV